MWYLGREARLLTFDGRMLLGSSARSSGEVGTKVRVSVLAGSQDFLPGIGNIQSGNLRVIAGVRTVREAPTFTFCLYAALPLAMQHPSSRHSALVLVSHHHIHLGGPGQLWPACSLRDIHERSPPRIHTSFSVSYVEIGLLHKMYVSSYCYYM